MINELPPFVLEVIHNGLQACKEGVEREGDKFFGPRLDVVYCYVFNQKTEGGPS